MNSEQLTTGARTVAHLGDYLEELKQAALELKSRTPATVRGYFTPTEDEEARHLLVSYSQSRAALLELVSSFHQDTELDDPLRPPAFVVAFAAALLLIDAARFLRETFGESAVVRHKLNEAEPRFGIPAGTYDAVQRSLTSPLYAWHIYHATRYFAENERQLREVGHDPALRPSLDVIDRLGHRADVAAGRYAKARLRARVRDVGHGVGRDFFGRALYGLIKMASSTVSNFTTRPGHRPNVPAAVRLELDDMLQPGDVIVTRKEYAVTNYFLPGYWPHVALYLGDAEGLVRRAIHEHVDVRPRWERLLAGPGEEARRVLEALKDGVRIRSVDSPFSSDAVAIVRPRLHHDDIAQALARGLSHEGKPYDFDFDFTRSDRLVCTEVVYRSYEGVGATRFELTRRAGRLTLAAEDLLAMALERNAFEPLGVYAPGIADRLLTGGEADDALRATNGPG